MALQKLTECQQIVMKCIWSSSKDMTLHEVMQLTNQKYAKVWKPQTVSTFLRQLVKKNYLVMYRDSQFRYRKQVDEEVYVSHLLKEHIHFWNNNNAASFAANLCKTDTLTPEQIRVLRESLRELDG